MLPNREGLFHAQPLEIGVAETGPNKLATCTMRFGLFEELVQGQWRDCSAENLEITGYFYLEKRDGSLNAIAIDALKAALGWDGRDPFWLQDAAEGLREQPVQVKLGFEEYNGQQRIKVQFLNPHGAAPSGVSKADDAARRSISNRICARLRAQAGGTPAPAPKPEGRPGPPPPKAPGKDAKPETATMEQAWASFCEAYEKAGPEGATDEQREQAWFAAIAKLFPGRQPDDLTPADWAVVREKAPGEIIPF